MTNFSVVGTHPYIRLQIICCSFKKGEWGGAVKTLVFYDNFSK